MHLLSLIITRLIIYYFSIKIFIQTFAADRVQVSRQIIHFQIYRTCIKIHSRNSRELLKVRTKKL